MRKFLLLLALTSYLHAEPSAFGAGDLSLDKPYGLTDSEKFIKKNKDSVKQLTRDKIMISSSVEQLKSDIDGLRSVMEGLTHGKQNTQKLIKKILVSQDDLEVAAEEFKQHFKTTDANISELSLKLTTLIEAQNENYKKIKEKFKKFDETVEIIEKSYVSKKSFNALQEELNQLRTLITTKFKSMGGSSSKSVSKSVSKSGAQLFKEGKEALKLKHFKTAATRFTGSISKNYKPATSHFYAGEAYFNQKKYKKAISFYKESYKRHKKASFSAKLLLHMGESLHRSGSKNKALKVFKQLLKKYPKSREAKAAKKYLKN